MLSSLIVTSLLWRTHSALTCIYMEMGVGGKPGSGQFPKPVEELASGEGPQVWLLLVPLCDMVLWHHDLRDAILVIMHDVCVLSLLLDHVTRCIEYSTFRLVQEGPRNSLDNNKVYLHLH